MNPTTTPPTPPRDEGSVLPMILALMVVGSLSVVALLTFATTLFTNRPPIEVRDRTFWTAKSAMSMAMTLQREHGPDGCYQATDSVTMNGFTADITCTPTGNYFGTGRGRYAVITTTNNPTGVSLAGRGAAAAVKPITGDVFVNAGGFGVATSDVGISTGVAGVPSDVVTSNATSIASPLARYADPTIIPPAPQVPTDCSNPAVAASMAFPNPGADWTTICQAQPWSAFAGDLNGAGAYDYPELPPLPAYLRPSVAQATIGSCNVYFPGRYETPLTLGAGRHFFPSGVYYFEDVLTLSPGAQLVAGEGRWGGCTFDAEAAFAPTAPNFHAITGKGATLVFGGSGRLVANDASIQINRRVSDSTSRGTETVAIRSVNFRTTPHTAAAPAEVPDDVVYLADVYDSANSSCNASLSTTTCLQRAADHSVRITPTTPICALSRLHAGTDRHDHLDHPDRRHCVDQSVRDRRLHLRAELTGIADRWCERGLPPPALRRRRRQLTRAGLRRDAVVGKQLVPRRARRADPTPGRSVRLGDGAERSADRLEGDHGGQHRRELCDQRLDRRPERRHRHHHDAAGRHDHDRSGRHDHDRSGRHDHH